MMDIDDDFELELALSLSKSDDFSEKLDDDLDYAFAQSLQSNFDDEDLKNPPSPPPPPPKINFEQSSSGQEKAVDKSDGDSDYMLALSLQSEFDKQLNTSSECPTASQVPSSDLKAGSKTPLSIVDNEWEVLDPIPNIHNLFTQFNNDFFWGTLEGIEVRWSPRMTLCAGICCYEGHGGLCSVRLSQPLLKYRPRRDLVETLLHEMIHAYLFVTHNNKDHDAHGPEFLKHMNRINYETGTKISVYHSFHDEVDVHRKHWWKCNGPCQHRKPFYGLVKRAMNRAPSPRDPWWAAHQAKCGGTFVKVKEPDDYGKKKAIKRKQDDEKINEEGLQKDIQNYFSPNGSKKASTISNIQAAVGSETCEAKYTGSYTPSLNVKGKKAVIPFSGKGYKLGTGTVETHNPRNATPPKEHLLGTLKRGSLDLKSRNKPGGLYLQGADNSSVSNGQTRPKGNGNTHNRNRHKPSAASRNRGSTTLVLNAKAEYEGKVKGKNAPTPYFSGKGHVLGGESSSKGNQNKAKSPTSKQELMTTFIKTVTPKDESDDIKKLAVVFSSDSEDESPPDASNENVMDRNLELVPCPACGAQVESQTINHHLDICLSNF